MAPEPATVQESEGDNRPAAEPIIPSPETRVAELEARTDELEKQINGLNDRFLRALAEVDNIRKRAERDKAEMAKYAISKFAYDVVGVSDNFQRAIASVPAEAVEQNAVLKALLDGVTVTERQFLNVLERHGVKRIEPKGEPFNPRLHQAVQEQHNAEVAAGIVLQVFQAGYLIEDRVLRPAMVVVATGGPKPVKPEAAKAETEVQQPAEASADSADTQPKGNGSGEAKAANNNTPEKGG